MWLLERIFTKHYPTDQREQRHQTGDLTGDPVSSALSLMFYKGSEYSGKSVDMYQNIVS